MIISLCILALLTGFSEAGYLEQAEELSILKDDNLKLIFASALWRHGDRAPEVSLPGNSDRLKESDWKFGGGGYGQLSPVGMRQHFNLGRKLRSRYMSSNFLSSRYRAKEIYIRSTDVNRTLISAHSNLAGMYSNEDSNVKGTDLPNVEGWPSGWVPIPVHTVFNPTDHDGNPSAKCPRLAEALGLIIESAEVSSYLKQPKISQVMDFINEKTGAFVSVDKMYDFNNTLMVQKLHFNDTKPENDNATDYTQWYPWYWQGDIPQLIKRITDKSLEFDTGLENLAGVKNIDVSLEISRLRAGESIESIRTHGVGVLHCYLRNNLNDTSHHCSHYFRKLKYYALSAHDSTLNAMLTLLGARQDVLQFGNPQYSSALLVEFYIDESTKKAFVKFLYHANENENFRVITPFVSFCPIDSQYCPLEKFTELVNKYNPGDIEKLCNTPLQSSSA